MTLSTPHSGMGADSVAAPTAHIRDWTSRVIRVYLTELAEGTSNYRSLYTLTQHIEHQYHSRFLIELIQNAHDALGSISSSDTPHRIEVVFDHQDSEHGTLLVANDGQPFSRSNFERIAQLGQSDKDPASSIGNKGIGFRSVLEIANAPEIYSRVSSTSSALDGFCFAFRPDVVGELFEPIMRLVGGDNTAATKLTDLPLVDWNEGAVEKLRMRVLKNGAEWLRGELQLLSPYLLPIPVDPTLSAAVRELATAGFSTIVRLPLKSASHREVVLKRLVELGPATALYLEKLGRLAIRGPGQTSRSFERRVQSIVSPGSEMRRELVCINDDSGVVETFHCWSRAILLDQAPQSVHSALAGLHGSWRELRSATVSVSVRQGDIPRPGVFSIFLPTTLPTGSAVHFNAPFYGDISRTSIDFAHEYNAYLLSAGLKLSIDAACSLAGRDKASAQLIVDLLGPISDDPKAAEGWKSRIRSTAASNKVELEDTPLLLADRGWRTPREVHVLPPTATNTVVTEAALRRHVSADVLHPDLTTRTSQIVGVCSRRELVVSLEVLAGAVAAIAATLHPLESDWNTFWADVIRLMPHGQAHLAKHSVLICNDGKLHKASDGDAVFFPPRKGVEDEDIASEGGALSVPPLLHPHVGFLASTLMLYEHERNVQTPLHKYLANELVSPFRVDSILREVLTRITPKLPVPLEGAAGSLCGDIIHWAAKLMTHLVEREGGTPALFRQLGKLPVPCQGGWFPMEAASFGPGWPGTSGDALATYLAEAKGMHIDEAARRVLLAPGAPRWGSVTAPAAEMLSLGGVFDGLRLVEISPLDWDSKFVGQREDVRLPVVPPPAIGRRLWDAFRLAAETEAGGYIPYSTKQEYRLGAIHALPGMDRGDELNLLSRAALSELILASLPKWEASSQRLSADRTTPTKKPFAVESPLFFYLKTSNWLHIPTNDTTKGVTPSRRWHVPSQTIAHHSRQFAYLNPLSTTLAKRLESSPNLAKALYDLGMPRIDFELESDDKRWLQAIAIVIDSNKEFDTNALVSHLRDAWHIFRPQDWQQPLSVLVVRGLGKQLLAVTPTEQAPVFVPDRLANQLALEQNGDHVMVINARDAHALKPWLRKKYGNAVQFTSELETLPQWPDSYSPEPVAFAASDLGWLTKPLLAMVAHLGAMPGAQSSAFHERARALKTAQVSWVPELWMVVASKARELFRSRADALWVPSQKVLYVAEACREQPRRASMAFAQLLEREELETHLKLFFTVLNSLDSAPSSLDAFFEATNIQRDQFEQVASHLKGDAGAGASFISVLAALLHPDRDWAGLGDIQEEEQLVGYLKTNPVSGYDPTDLCGLAMRSGDLFSFAKEASTGKTGLTLDRWNECLRRRGDAPLVNREWADEFQAVLREATGTLQRLVAWLVRSGELKSYVAAKDRLAELPRQLDLSESVWQADFGCVMHYVSSLLRDEWACPPQVVAAVKSSATPEELRLRLVELHAVVEFDPEECFRRNSTTCRRIAEELESIRLAWMLKGALVKSPNEWKSHETQRVAGLEQVLRRDGYTLNWADDEVLRRLGAVDVPGEPTAWRAALRDAEDLADVGRLLHLAPEEVLKATGRLKDLRDDARRAENRIDVCGKSFDPSDETLGQLWDLHVGAIDDASLLADGMLDLNRCTSLRKPVSPSGEGRSDKRGNGVVRKRRSKVVDEAVGMMGEIIAFRMLQATYGANVVTPRNWRSGNAKRVYSQVEADDSFGCDIVFSSSGTTYHVEVKASTGDEEVFSLGSSEIALARKLTRKPKKERFVIVHVKNALAARPLLVVLPNPYDRCFEHFYRLDEAEARVRYSPTAPIAPPQGG